MPLLRINIRTKVLLYYNKIISIYTIITTYNRTNRIILLDYRIYLMIRAIIAECEGGEYSPSLLSPGLGFDSAVDRFNTSVETNARSVREFQIRAYRWYP